MSIETTHVQAGAHRLEVSVFGQGVPAVVIEPAFGGSAESWLSIANTLATETTVVTYDRAPYGSSSRAQDDRTPIQIAQDLHSVLDALGIDHPVVLVGHSAGGVYVRAFAGLYSRQVAGMVLVDSAHEAQEQVRGLLPWRTAVLEALTLPLLRIAPSAMLNGADRRSMIREFRASKRLTAADQPLASGGLGDRPLIVLTRGPGAKTPESRSWRLWHGLHEDLAGLSTNHRHIVAHSPDHYLHKSEPELVVTAIRDVLNSVEQQTHLSKAPTIDVPRGSA